jgi:hypothetical protein
MSVQAYVVIHTEVGKAAGVTSMLTCPIVHL